MKLLGHAVWLGRGLAINALSFPAIMTCLWSFWFLDHQAERERARRHKYRRTNGESRSFRPQKQTPKKESCIVIQWETSGSLHHSGPVSQTECDLRLRLWLLKYSLLLTASNCNKWCNTLEYSSSTVSLLQKSIMCTFKRHFCSCLLANTYSCRLCLFRTLSSSTAVITPYLMFVTVMNEARHVSDQTFTMYFFFFFFF